MNKNNEGNKSMNKNLNAAVELTESQLACVIGGTDGATDVVGKVPTVRRSAWPY